MEWPFTSNTEENSISVNQRMLRKLTERTLALKERPTKDKRLAKAFGRGVERFRGQTDYARIQCAAKVSLDSGFLTLVETGDSLIEEINREDVFDAIVAAISTDANTEECREYLDKILREGS